MNEMELEYSDILKYRGINNEDITLNLFDIGDTLYSENIISNWYAFFFDSEEEHKLSNLFLNSLLELISNNTEIELEMDGCSVIREYGTGKGFIDLVIYDGKDEEFESAIIVENKINASLNNDLDDYYDSIKVKDKKIGIVLSIAKISFENINFINITHYDLIKSIKNNLSQYLVKASDKHLLYLKDFIETIELISKPIEMDDDIKFYIENSEKINRLIEFKNKAETFLTDSIKLELVKTDNLEWFRKNKDSLTLKIIDTDYRIYINQSDLFETGEFIIEVWASNKNDVLKFNDEKRGEIAKKFHNLTFEWNTEGQRWLEIGYKEYDGINSNDFGDIGNIIYKNLKKDFTELITYLKNEI